ncbi:amino acid ABC transporter permease [Streptomyces tanashiensis]
MRKGQTMLYVLLPQAVTVMLPALVSQLVVIVKDTALGGALLGFEELLNQNRQITANYGANTIATLVVIALIYIVLNFALTTFAGRLERRLRQGRKSAAVTLPAQAGAAEAKSKAVSDA